MTALFLSVRTTGGLLPAGKDLAGASAMLWSRILQAQAETVETVLPAQGSFYFRDMEALRVQAKNGSSVFALTLAFPGHCTLRHCLCSPPGLKWFWGASSRRKAGGNAFTTVIYLPLKRLTVFYNQRRENKIGWQLTKMLSKKKSTLSWFTEFWK